MSIEMGKGILTGDEILRGEDQLERSKAKSLDKPHPAVEENPKVEDESQLAANVIGFSFYPGSGDYSPYGGEPIPNAAEVRGLPLSYWIKVTLPDRTIKNIVIDQLFQRNNFHTLTDRVRAIIERNHPEQIKLDKKINPVTGGDHFTISEESFNSWIEKIQSDSEYQAGEK